MMSVANVPPLLAIVGPTASGKSTLGIFLARKFGGEVVACDSTQLYRGFDVGTAKPTLAERAASWANEVGRPVASPDDVRERFGTRRSLTGS